MGFLGTDFYMSSVIWRLKRNKRNQGNFLPNHSRLILETFITGLWWDYSPKQSDISATDTSMCIEHCRAWHLHGLCEIWGEAHLPGAPMCAKACPGSRHRVFPELPLPLGMNPPKYLHVFCSYSNKNIATVCLT